MQRKSLVSDECPIARSLERVGEWWSILIMRDALHGLRRFDEFSRSLGIAPNMLTRPLARRSSRKPNIASYSLREYRCIASPPLV